MKEISRAITQETARSALEEGRRISGGRVVGETPLFSRKKDTPPVVRTLRRPRTDHQRTVDAIEQDLAKVPHHKAYPALTILELFETRAWLRALDVPSKEQTAYGKSPLSRKKILVAGAGTGREVIAAAALGADVTAFDITKSYLEQAAHNIAQASAAMQHTLNVKLRQSPAERFPYGENKWDDISFLFGGMNHTKDNEYEGIIAKMAKGLRQGGTLSLSMYGQDPLVFKMRKEGLLLYDPSIQQRRVTGGIQVGASQDVLPTSFPSPSEIFASINNAGLTIKRVFGYLRFAALFPKDPTPDNLNKFRTLLGKIDQGAAAAIAGYETSEEILLAIFAYDCMHLSEIDEFAYFGVLARK